MSKRVQLVSKSLFCDIAIATAQLLELTIGEPILATFWHV